MYVHRAADALSVSADSVKWLGKWVAGCSHLYMIRLKAMGDMQFPIRRVAVEMNDVMVCEL
jgi:hypothetical protein